MRSIYITIYALFFLCLNGTAQTEPIPFALNTTKENRAKEYRNLVNNSINKNLSLVLSDSTEEYWEDAFYAMESINYRSVLVDKKIYSAFDSLEKRTVGFQRALLELAWAIYPTEFVLQIRSFIKQTRSLKIFAIGAEYILMNKKDKATLNLLRLDFTNLNSVIHVSYPDPIIISLVERLNKKYNKTPPLADLLDTGFLKNQIVLYSFQRKNRNYPGLAMVRGKDGRFIKEETGKYFFVSQLARSMSNMPGYLTNGNTPQGIFKITGFDVSKGSFIGPTTNIQMVLPFERSPDVADSIPQLLGHDYKKLLPASWQEYHPVFEAYYAGRAGRTEIIAHGTTVNPAYYKHQPWYPISPTQGCLCSKEIWSEINGIRLVSDQQKLVNALQKAGGANGYCVVIEIDDQQKLVSLQEILPYLNKKIK